LASLIASPALANLDEEYDSYDYDDDVETYSAPATMTTKTHKRDTYLGLRIHRNEHIAYQYKLNSGHTTTIRDNNFGVGLNIGNRLTDNVKLEFETLYTGKHEKQSHTDFDYDVWSNMLNVYLYKNYGGAVEPYFGIGMGLSGIWANIDSPTLDSHDNEFDLSFAVMAGVNFALNDYVDLNLGLRYIDYGDVKHEHASTKIEATEIYIGGAYKFSIFK
jgi:opacity protein-like surface antigen